MRYVPKFSYPFINGPQGRRLRRSKGPGMAKPTVRYDVVGVARGRPDKLRGFWHPNRPFKEMKT